MAKVELKQPVVDAIKAMLEGAAGAVIVDYRGLTCLLYTSRCV